MPIDSAVLAFSLLIRGISSLTSHIRLTFSGLFKRSCVPGLRSSLLCFPNLPEMQSAQESPFTVCADVCRPRVLWA